MRHLVVFSLIAILIAPPGLIANAQSAQGDICTASTARQDYNDRIDRLLFDKVPSLMEDCGIGGLFDLCGLLGGLGSTLGSFVGANCGGGGGSGNTSLFCGFGFDLKSAKDAYGIYMTSIEHRKPESTIDTSQEPPAEFASILDDSSKRLHVLGVTSDIGV